MGWIGHTLRKPASNVNRQALEWNPQGKFKVGRPKQTWCRSVDAAVKAAEMMWAGLKRISQTTCVRGVLLWPYVPKEIKRHKKQKKIPDSHLIALLEVQRINRYINTVAFIKRGD